MRPHHRISTTRTGARPRLRPAAVGILLCALLLPNLHSQGNDLTALVGASAVTMGPAGIIEDAVVLIQDGVIVELGPAANTPIPSAAHQVDLGGRYLLPGLMNMHTHLGIKMPGQMSIELADETPAELSLRMAKNAEAIVESGVTTIRLTGDPAHADLALKEAIDRGDFPGPRIFPAGREVVITAGHGSQEAEETFDGPDELMGATRQEIAAGASWIKILISGGIATPGGSISEALMKPAEIRAVVDTAHRLGAKVTAHSGSPAATSAAIDAGIDCIEHGYFHTPEISRKMQENGTWLVPTIVVTQPGTLPFYKRHQMPEWYLERLSSVGRSHWNALEQAIRAGVNIAVGTDQLPSEPNDGTTATIREIEYYVDAGMSPLDALRAGTIQPARLLGAETQIGSLEKGKAADIIAVSENPTTDISTLRSLSFVMKGGTIVRNDWTESLETSETSGPARQAADEIRGIRARSNHAIRARDLPGLRQTWVTEVVVAASSGTVYQNDREMAEAFESSFADPAFVTYVRTPTSVQVSQNGRFAAERGRWEGSWNREDGREKVLGTYQAQWIRSDEGWKIRAELFVALECLGSRACAERN